MQIIIQSDKCQNSNALKQIFIYSKNLSQLLQQILASLHHVPRTTRRRRHTKSVDDSMTGSPVYCWRKKTRALMKVLSSFNLRHYVIWLNLFYMMHFSLQNKHLKGVQWSIVLLPWKRFATLLEKGESYASMNYFRFQLGKKPLG